MRTHQSIANFGLPVTILLAAMAALPTMLVLRATGLGEADDEAGQPDESETPDPWNGLRLVVGMEPPVGYATRALMSDPALRRKSRVTRYNAV